MFRGERFEADFGQDNEIDIPKENTPLPGAFVSDVLERKPTAAKPPSLPTLKSKTGFPEHGRPKAESRFKRKQNASKQAENTPTSSGQQGPGPNELAQSNAMPSGKPTSWDEEEKQRIDRENRQHLDAMSPEQIEQERLELMNALGPEMIQKLLRKSNIDSGGAESDLQARGVSQEPEAAREPKRGTGKSVSFAEPEPAVAEENGDEAEDTGPQDDSTSTSEAHLPSDDSVHFPRPIQPPDLDPSSDTFLTDLHQKYFPTLPSDPDKLAWMQDSSAKTKTPGSKPDPYSPSATALNAKDIRFDFTGALLPPRTAASIPVTAGLHHHGDAPESAGYTIGELAHLARSTFPAQRCIAFQTLGRILYRLGRGEFGDAGDETSRMGMEGDGEVQEGMGELARGLWGVVEKERVLAVLVSESEGEGVDGGRHVSARAYATEAVWLWQRGGGRRVGAQ